MKGKCSMGSKKGLFSAKETSFIDKLFSWSLEDVLNKDLLTNQVEKIPESFLSVRHYFKSYVLPLLEETRAEISSSLEAVSRAPFAEVLSFEESQAHGSLHYEVTIDCWRNNSSVKAKEPYRTLPGDIFLVSNARVDDFSDLQQANEKFALAWLPKVTDNADGSTVCKFKIKASKDLSANNGRHKKLFLVFLINTTCINRIWKSLHFYENVNIIKEVLCTTGELKEVCDHCSLYTNAIYAERLALQLPPGLNESQKGAIVSSLCKIQCRHKSFVELIWGPPGTGKTSTAALLLLTALAMNSRVLTCAPTNVAITELASRVLKESTERIHSSFGEGVFLSLGDLLLFGNNDRLKVTGELRKLYLDYRIDELVTCLGAGNTGWKHCFSSISAFLQDFVSQYHKFLENESGKEQVRNKGRVYKYGKSLVGFMQERFRSITLPLRRCIQALCTHLPKSFLLDSNIEKLTLLIQLLNKFETLIFSTAVASKTQELEEVFSNPFAHPSPYSTLMQVRNQCLSVIGYLNHSLGQLKLPKSLTKSSLKKFCFQKASLIFCTVSSSFQLYSVEMEPLSLLVIDEAAQLKESESTIPLKLPGIMHAILIGDEYQLPAIVQSKVSSEAGFGRSLFERLSALGHSKHLLNVQYRMHPLISCFPNLKFYGNQILDAPEAMDRIFRGNYLEGPMFGPYSFINISGDEERDNLSGSWKNMAEIAVILRILQKLHVAWKSLRKNLTVGIISPYNAQVLAIQEKIGNKYDKLTAFSVKVKSVDGFQGGEEDIIIISTVRSNSSGSVGFVSNGQRTNVALTRARQCLWILGNGRTLHSSGSVWKSVISDAKDRSCFFNADEDVDLGNSIIKVAKGVLRLNDLCIADSLPYKMCRWKVIICDDFVSSFGKLKSESLKKMVIFYLLKLSSGWRPERIGNSGDESSSQIIKCYNVEGLFVVCTIDIETDLKQFQVLKIWNILPPEDVPSFVQWLDGAIKIHTDEFVTCCKQICLEGNLEVPMTWTKSHKLVQFKVIQVFANERITDTDTAEEIIYDETVDAMSRLSSMRSYPLSCGIVCQLLDPHRVGKLDLQYQEPGHELESEILLYPRSTFVVGRPSSKKLSILVRKMFNNEKIESDTKTETTKPSALRQIFVCVTPRTCATVRQYVSQMKRGKDTVTETASIDVHDVDDAESIFDILYGFDTGSSESYPLVITFRHFVMMLDASVGHSFFERFSTLNSLLDIKSRILDSGALQALIKTKEVTSERFISSYWHLFDCQLTKKLDSFMVFTEITFCIKGSLQRGESFDGILSREDYVRLSRGTTTILNRKKKMRIYEIFLQYEKRKAEQDEFDLADLTIDIHHRLNGKKYERKLMDFVFVDEVQKLNMKQISLFRIICKDLEKGLVFSSDMVNTITSQNGFQFKEIRSLYSREFLPAHMKEGDRKGPTSRELSDIFHLNQNMYTSVGVLRLSQSVMDLLFRFFSSSVDILSPEICQNHTTGEVPIVVTPKEGQNIITAVFDKNQDDGTNPFSFGAQQVLLVRDNYTRNKIAAVVGEKALVLTIMECQGLEFQDVFLYNFFCSSPLIEEEWRVIFEYMKEQDMVECIPDKSIPTSHPAKHGNLCWELKQLYTAITRARKRLWILENAVELSCPMFDYWKKLSYVHARQLDDSLVKAIQTTSSRKDWRCQGIELYCEGLYDKAEMCFAKAKDVHRGTWAKAANLRAAAGHVRALQSDIARESIKKAAKLFGGIHRSDSVVQCLIEAEEYESAGLVFMERSKMEDDGLCFSLAASYKCPLEAYPGSLVESEGTSRMKQCILLEVNLLATAKRYKDASMLILLYVFANSLWASENKGWPLKPFKGKERLLRRAKVLAKYDSESLYEVISLEANILLNQEKSMTGLISDFIASDNCKILACSILSARKIIDMHLKADIEELEFGHDISLRECSNEMLFLETLCVESLVYFWNFWKQKIMNILQYLVGDRSQDMDESTECEMSLYKYLGVWKSVTSGGNILMLISSDAQWVKKIYQRNQRFIIGTDNFISAAQEFFSSEFFSVSMKVLEYLKALLIGAIKNSLSLSCCKIILSSCLQIITCLVEFKFQPSLDNEILDNVLDTGLASILSWNQHRGLGHSIFEGSSELDQKVHAFLSKCILHYQQLQDSTRMMKFVRALPSMDSIRPILEPLDCFHDLSVLEVESENFMDAANFANSQGNFLLEIDLLEKGGQYNNATTLMLTYVLPHSLWASGSKGWPLMDFGQKKDLLVKAKSFAKNVTEDFFEMTCVEADILSNSQVSLSKVKQSLRASQRHKNLRAEILCARKILDVHLCTEVLSYKWDHELKLDQADQIEETTFHDQVSFESLVYFWKLWEANIISILGCLSCQVGNGHSTYKEFCLNYFGLRMKLRDQTFPYVLLLPNASWVQYVEIGSFEMNKFSINDSQLVFAARSYWCAEILSVGAKVLDKLKALYLSSVSMSMSLFRQSIVGIRFFEVAKFLMESVSVGPSDTHLFDKILEAKSQFIQDCAQNLTMDFCMGSKGGALPDVECSLLRSCALHYHNLQDHQRMMMFVNKFHSVGCKRLFLKSVNCLDELLLLEQESGNFLDAVAVAHLKRDFLLEIDLLEKCGCFKEASSLILLYALANSLWSSGNNGWPFKLSKRSKKLLIKAKNFAKNHSDALYNYICAEANVLLGCKLKICEMHHLFHVSQENINFTGQILCSRMILDAHLSANASEYEWEDLFAVNISEYVKIQSCKNQKSVHTLYYFWNFWSEKVLRIIEYLENLDTQCIHNGNCDAEEFCLKYLGVRKELTDGIPVYSLFNSNACWRKNSQNGSAKKDDASVTMDATQFVTAAKRFWCSELLAVGLMVLKYLDALRTMSIEMSFSLFSQTISVIHIFEVAKFLSASSVIKSVSDSNELENFILSSSECFLENVFSIKCTTSMDEKMIALRGTRVSREILKEVISRRAASESCFSYEVIGEIVMIMLGSETFIFELCEGVVNRFRTNQAWKPFIDILIKTTETQSPEEIVRSITLESWVEKFPKVVKLHEALEITYNARSESDCASPACVLYILERLQILVSEFRGCFYTTKFSFIEWLICVEWRVSSSTGLPHHMETLLRRTCDFMVQIVQQIVVNQCDTAEWIEKSKIKVEEFYPQLVLRLVILLCLLCINSGKYHGVLYDLLGKAEVRSQLPLEFYNTLQSRHKKRGNFLLGFAKALEETGSSLVVVNVGDQPLENACQNVISVRMKDIRCREDAMKILFPEKSKDVNSNNDAIHLRCPKKRSCWRVKCENSSKSSEPDQIHRKLWEIFDNLFSVADGKDWKSPMIKVNLPKDLDHVSTVLMQKLLKDKSKGALIEEVNSMLDELKELSAALNLRYSLSDQQLEQNVSEVKGICQKLHSRRQRLEPNLDHLHSPKVDEVQACSSTSSTSEKRCSDSRHMAAEKSTPKKTSKVVPTANKAMVWKRTTRPVE